MRALSLLACSLLVVSATGCELIASVDRTAIQNGGASGSGGEAGTGGNSAGTAGQSGSGGSSATGGSGGSAGTAGTAGMGASGGMAGTAGTGGGGTAGGGTGGGGMGGGGTGGTGGTGATAGTGGGGTGGTGGSTCAMGIIQCSAPSDCPDPGNECITRTCDAGCCGTEFTSASTPTTAQTAKDCKMRVCDGAGFVIEENDDADIPDSLDSCHEGACDLGNGLQVPAAEGSPCNENGGHVCHQQGFCVECLKNAGCSGTTPVCSPAQTCVSATCSDTIKNGTETDVDCGGGCGATCETDQICGQDTDCLSGVCMGVCQAPSCSDGVKNGDETAPDCGGSCAVSPGFLCAVGQGCSAASDCETDSCDGTVCTYKSQGATCTSHDDCGAPGTNLCVDGVCCDTDCTNGCMACSAAKKGGGANGICGNIIQGTDPNNVCNDEGSTTCGNTGVCDGAGACAKYAAGTTCRPASGICDVAEICAGGGAACPTNGFLPNGTPVASGQTPGDCQQIVCTGTSANGVTSADDPTDLPTSNTICLFNAACSGAPLSPSFDPAPTGTNCTSDPGNGNVCGDTSNPLVAGTCVECNSTADCPMSTTCNTTTHVCEI